MWLEGAAAFGHILLWTHRAHSACFQASRLHTPHPNPPLPQSLSFLLHCTIAYSCRLSLDIPIIVLLPRRWVECQAMFQPLSCSEIIYRVYAQVPPSFSMQSGQLEPIRTRGLCKELAAQTTITIHLPLIATDLLIALRLSRPSDRRDGTCHAYFPIAYFPTMELRICAQAPLKLSALSFAKFALSFHAYCSVPAYGHAYMHDRKRDELRDWRGTAENICMGIYSWGHRLVIGTKHLSITTWFHKAMQDLKGANLSGTALLSPISG